MMVYLWLYLLVSIIVTPLVIALVSINRYDPEGEED